MHHPFIVWGCVALILLILVRKFGTRKHALVDKYEYLEVLSFTEWKAGRQIKIELERLKGGYLDYSEVYINLAYLEDEGLVERDISQDQSGKLHKFRKKSAGRRIRDNPNDEPILAPTLCPA